MIKKTWSMTGKIVSGLGKGSYFVGLDWVQEQCMEKLGFRPYPGTLNLRIEGDALHLLEQLQNKKTEKLIPPDPEFCAAKVLPVTIENERGAIIVPDEAVRVHGKEVVEIMAPLRLKNALNVADGDSLTVVVSVVDK